jgi:ComF family protein
VLGADECAVCGKPALKMPLCPACLKKHILTHEGLETRCKKCGKPLISETAVCMKCRLPVSNSSAQDTLIEFCFPVFTYRLWMKELLFNWKTRGIRLFSPVFARVIAQALCDDMNEKEAVIVPVPPRPGKIKNKGWDQVEDLCAWLELTHNVQILRVLKRRSKAEQKKLDKQERQVNARKAYFLDERARKKIAEGKIILPKKVILLDDVRTTGATLETCAASLKAQGVEEVKAIVLFGVD